MVYVIFLEETEFASRGTSKVLVVATCFADQSRSACLAMALQLSCLTTTSWVRMSSGILSGNNCLKSRQGG